MIMYPPQAGPDCPKSCLFLLFDSTQPVLFSFCMRWPWKEWKYREYNVTAQPLDSAKSVDWLWIYIWVVKDNWKLFILRHSRQNSIWRTEHWDRWRHSVDNEAETWIDSVILKWLGFWCDFHWFGHRLTEAKVKFDISAVVPLYAALSSCASIWADTSFCKNR